MRARARARTGAVTGWREDDLACTKSTKLNFAPLAHAIYEPWLYRRAASRRVGMGDVRSLLSNGV